MRAILFLIALSGVLMMAHPLFSQCGDAEVPDGLYLNKNAYDGAVCRITIHLWGVPLMPSHPPYLKCRQVPGTSDYENCVSEHD
jgi:hypothetical protein